MELSAVNDHLKIYLFFYKYVTFEWHYSLFTKAVYLCGGCSDEDGAEKHHL